MCSSLRPDAPPADDAAAFSLDALDKNIVEFIQALRKIAAAWNDLDVYALMVFDFALIQVEGWLSDLPVTRY